MTAADDRHPIFREMLAFAAEFKQISETDKDLIAALLAGGVDVPGRREAIEAITSGIADAVFERIQEEGIAPSKAIWDAIRMSILFGIRLARKQLA